jgi:hypothetical protein
MIRFYTYLFACAYVNAERQWKTVNGAAYNALMVVTLTLLLHFATLFGALPALLNLPLPNTHLDKAIVAPFLAVLASGSWLVIVRNGKGVRLAEELKKKGEDSVTICQIVTLGSLVLYHIHSCCSPTSPNPNPNPQRGPLQLWIDSTEYVNLAKPHRLF